jgi:hypothetical protein
VRITQSGSESPRDIRNLSKAILVYLCFFAACHTSVNCNYLPKIFRAIEFDDPEEPPIK